MFCFKTKSIALYFKVLLKNENNRQLFIGNKGNQEDDGAIEPVSFTQRAFGSINWYLCPGRFICHIPDDLFPAI